jgi:hypothetical protein
MERIIMSLHLELSIKLEHELMQHISSSEQLREYYIDELNGDEFDSWIYGF